MNTPVPSRPPFWRRPLGIAAEIATLLAAVIAVLTYVQLQPGGPVTAADHTPTDRQGATDRPSAGTGQAAPPPIPSAPGLRYLDAMAPQAGAGYLRRLPRALEGQPAYAHALAITCPTNQTGDKVREVTYDLRGRYLRFTASVQPFYDPADDARVDAIAVLGTEQRDGTMTTEVKGRQSATMTAPAQLSASVEDGRQLILRVQCEYPGGLVILSGAGLVPAT